MRPLSAAERAARDAAAHVQQGTTLHVFFPAGAPFEVVDAFVRETAERVFALAEDPAATGVWEPFVATRTGDHSTAPEMTRGRR